MAEETVIGSFVEGARVRALALARLAEAIGGDDLAAEVRTLLVSQPLPLPAGAGAAVPALRAAYAAQEQAVVAIAARLDTR